MLKAWQSRCTHPSEYRLASKCSAQKMHPSAVASSAEFPRAPVLWAHIRFARTTAPLDLALPILIKIVVLYKRSCSSARLENVSVRQNIGTVNRFHVDLRRFGRHLSDFILCFVHKSNFTNTPHNKLCGPHYVCSAWSRLRTGAGFWTFAQIYCWFLDLLSPLIECTSSALYSVCETQSFCLPCHESR